MSARAPSRPWIRAALTAAAALVCARIAHAEPSARPKADAEEMARLHLSRPNALALLERGEADLEAHDPAAAEARFRDAAAEAPDSALVRRRWCESLVQLRRRAEAITTCRSALERGGSPADFRATVGALMAGPEAPTPDELAQALMLARAARNSAPRDVAGYAAQCDIAIRLGDDPMLDDCLSDLRRIAPEHAETRAAASHVAARGPSALLIIGWGAILLAAAASLVREARQFARRRMRVARAAAALAALMVTFPATRAAAQGLSEWPVDDADPEAHIPSIAERERNPLEFGYWLMDVGEKADAAAKHGDHSTAVKLYRALARAVPDRSVSFSKMCASYEAMGDREHALESCGAALGREGVKIDDYARYARLVLAGKGALEPKAIDDLDAIVAHLEADPAAGTLAAELACELGVRLHDTARLERCTKVLEARAPSASTTLSFAWTLALQRGDYAEADRLVARAKTSAMSAEGIARMEQATAGATPVWRRALADRRAMLVLLLALAAMSGATVLLARRRTARPV